VREEVGKLPPVFLIGLSMGGLTSFRLSFKLKVRGCILYAPAFAPFTGSFLVGLGKFLGFLLPKTTVEKESDPTGSRNPAVTERSRKDPNATLFSPFGTLRSLLNAMEGSESLFGQMETPFVLVAGGRDKLVRLSSHEEMFRRAGTQDK
jgi:alpha-beta hydrolase superfamily lysophospholipase